MTPKSSAVSVPYDIRPSKQIERRIILDMLLIGAANGLPVSKSKYVGMGGVKFFDFIMFHKYLGLKEFTSLEHDRNVLPRCNFNRPFESVEIYDGSFGDFITDFRGMSPHIFWVDYDYGLSEDLKNDLLSAGSRLPLDSFLLLTVDGEPSKAMAKASSEVRMSQLHEQLGHFVGQRSLQEFEDDQFRNMAADILIRIVRYAFNARPDGIFFPILKMIYKDSSWMITVGGLFSTLDRSQNFIREWNTQMVFLPRHSNDRFYELPRFNITDSERRLLDMYTTKRVGHRRRRQIPRNISVLGFDRGFVSNYQQLIRYIPRYFESFT
jgi:hypothetical protein